jgi:hypothetical protein
MDQTMPDVVATLNAGARIVGAVIEPHGFLWVPGNSGVGHPGDFAGGSFVRDNRRLELHFRWSLGLVRYHVGAIVISHEQLIRYSGHAMEAQYPGFSSDPLDAFRHLAHDLQNYATNFIEGDGSTIVAAEKAANEHPLVSGFGRLP